MQPVEGSMFGLDRSLSVVRPPSLCSGWVYVSSLALKSYRKSPLLGRWCEIREEGKVMNFFRDKNDLEPTKCVHLEHARVVVSHAPRLSDSQIDRMRVDSISPGGSPRVRSPPSEPSSPRSPLSRFLQTQNIPESVVQNVTAFYIDFPTALWERVVESRRQESGGPPSVGLGFIMVVRSSDGSNLWEAALLSNCKTPITRDQKRVKVARWLTRAWMRLRGDLTEEQFDETEAASGYYNQRGLTSVGSESPPGSPRGLAAAGFSNNVCDDGEVFYTVRNVPETERKPAVQEIEWDLRSFKSAHKDSDSEQDDSEECSKKDTLTAKPENGIPILKFHSVGEMFACTDPVQRHSVPISKEEADDVIQYVERTKVFSEKNIDGESISSWSVCCEGENFDCYKSFDESTGGLMRTRTWAKIPGVPPHTLFHILYDCDTRKKWDHHFTDFERIYQEINDPDLDIIDAVVAAPIGCANREFLEWRRCTKNLTEGKFAIYLRSWEPPVGKPPKPVRKKAVRAEVWLSGYLIWWWVDPITGARLGSHVMVLTQIDIKGLVPKYIVNAVSASAPRKWVKSVTQAALNELQSMPNIGLETSNDELAKAYQLA